MGGRPRRADRSRPRAARLGLAGASEMARPRKDRMELFRCQSCGEVIGVYEPLVANDRNGARTTSRAAETELRASAAAYYHRDCFAAREQPERRSASGG